MGNFVVYSKDTGKITEVLISVDESKVTDLSDKIAVSRAEAEAVDKFYIVKDGVLVKMTALEQASVIQAEKDVADAQTAFMDGIKTKLKGLGFDDKEINFIINAH